MPSLRTQIFTIFIFLFSLCACTRPEPKEEIAPNIELSKIFVESKAGSQFLEVEAIGNWTLELRYNGEAKDWARVNTKNGENSNPAVILSWDENSSNEERTCTIVLKTKKETSINFTQAGKAQKPKPDYTGIETSTPAKWLELPATDRDDLYFITHDMTIGSKKTRNFSYYYDAEAMLALWVAYPLNSGLLAGNVGRTDDWGYDPKVPNKYQQELYKGYKGAYDRGHQLPSADRQTAAANRQTFYFTNMTPQKGELNQKQWASLEGRVRTWSEQCDTLYVVTGADFAKSKTYATDNVGQKIPVPTGYFKALLAYKKSREKYYGIAFYYEHKAYNNDLMDQSMTIDKLEEKLGIDFFVNLPAVTGQSVADKAESTIDSWWRQ